MSDPTFDIQHLAATEFIRQRIDPQPGDEPYLHLSDLLTALKPWTAAVSGRLLDFGCGGSPYRSLFGNAEYLRADMPPAEGVDYHIGADGKVPEADGRFDAVLSTQVLEHVADFNAYLAECFRLLRPGGRLLLSTHGSFFDHGCPYDYRRWTADGLKYDLVNAGFRVDSMQKLTTQQRGILFLAEDYLGHLWSSRRTRVGVALWLFQKWFWQKRAARHEWIDRKFPGCRVVDSSSPDPLYVCVLAVATKP